MRNWIDANSITLRNIVVGREQFTNDDIIKDDNINFMNTKNIKMNETDDYLLIEK